MDWNGMAWHGMGEEGRGGEGRGGKGRGGKGREGKGAQICGSRCSEASALTSDTWMLEVLLMPVRSAWEVKTSLIPSLGRTFSS